MIITCKKEVPPRWIAFAILPWASFTFNYGVISVVFFFSLKKFIENPAGLTFVLSLPSFVSLVLQPVVSFLSDRIWTRFGRRKPFIVTSLSGAVVCLALMPLMPNFWALLGIFMLYNAFSDLNSPMEPFKQEIIPPQERGRATGAMTWCSNLATMTFYFIALGRFDDVSYMGSFPLHGEEEIYWSAALLLIVMVMLITLGMHEIDQKSALRGQRLSLTTFFGGLLDRELWPVYLLVIGAACLNFYAGLGPLSNLLYTDQWNYTKQEMGTNVAAGGAINLVVIGLLTFFADRLNRMRAYQTVICLSPAMQIFYYCYVNFVLPDKHPSLIEIIVFGESLSILSILSNLVYIPLVYDYVRRNKMGTFNAGAQVVTRLTILVTLNGVGLFVWGYAILFQPPAGEMTRVVLRGAPEQQAEILGTLQAASWTYPGSGSPAPASQISVSAWQATGVVASTGRCWEVRLRDKDSAKLAAERDALTNQDSPLLAREKMDQDQLAILRRRSDTAAVAALEQKAAARRSRSDALDHRIAALNAELDTRAEKFHVEVVRALGSRIMTDGEQILGAAEHQAMVLDLPASRRATSQKVEAMTKDLQRTLPDFIDLRPLKTAGGYGLAASIMLPPHGDEATIERNLQAAVEQAADKADPGLLTPGTVPTEHMIEPAITLDLQVIEDPIDRHISPITGAVNAVLGLFHDAPAPDHRLIAMARDLQVPTETNQVRVSTGPGPRTLSVTAVLPPTASPSPLSDALTSRLDTLLGRRAPDLVVRQARQFYDRTKTAAATQRITVAQPTITTGYAAMKYDYMSGYLWMFVMGSIGISITFLFSRLEAKGFIRKRGVEEARKS